MGIRAAKVVVGLAASGALVLSLGVGSAGAAPGATPAQVQHRLALLNARADRLGAHYDEVLQQLGQANQRLSLVNTEVARYRRAFDAKRAEVGRIAAVAYEQGGSNSAIALLTSGSPQQILSQSSLLAELSSSNNAQLKLYLAASRQLVKSQQAARQTELGIAATKHSLAKQKKVLQGLISQQQGLLNQLTPSQQVGLGGGGSGHSTYHGSTKTQAGKAVSFAYGQLGCPYVWGGTGPCSGGFDCSGLTMESWLHAGISIPRVSYSQMGGLPSVPLHNSAGKFTTAYLQPGDILGFGGNSHVAIYIGNGYLIDAPDAGHPVQKVALSGWYLSSLDGAVRP